MSFLEMLFNLENEDEDVYSPTSWDQDPDESDEDYDERMDDQDSWLGYGD